MNTEDFSLRHIGVDDKQASEMLGFLGLSTIDELIEKVIPSNIRLSQAMGLGKGRSEQSFLNHIKHLSSKNTEARNYIGLGYHPAILPSVIQRNILENPGWYTAYTPYQAEISQGRLEALLNYQTMLTELTGMEISNASLLDEATAAAEGMQVLFSARSRAQKSRGANKFLVSSGVLPQTVRVLRTRARQVGIELVIGDLNTDNIDDSYFAVILQYPDSNGLVKSFEGLAEILHEKEVRLLVAADLMSLVVLEAPGVWGADVVVGTTQRFGIPLGYGGPHAAYFATREAYKRFIPGRIIGVSKDSQGTVSFRMALQTREQHIKRERATSNICTAQVLLAVMSGMYAVYHGPKGLQDISNRIHAMATTLEEGLLALGIKQLNAHYFDTLQLELADESTLSHLKALALEEHINFFYKDSKTICLSVNETTSMEDINQLLALFAKALGMSFKNLKALSGRSKLLASCLRKTDFLQHPVFNSYHSETEMMRYMKRLERKDLSLNHSMIPLGSCTMKLNAASQMLALSWSSWNNIHPFAPLEQARGYHDVFNNLEVALNKITGFSAASFQPNSGAQGEYTGLLAIRSYLDSIGQQHRKICLIPASAHGTNPASAHMAGMDVVVVKSTDHGDIDLNDLREKAERYGEDLAAMMLTYPSTHGVFELEVKKMIQIVHDFGGQVYMDGANMNAQVGLSGPTEIGADICHLNLHKTFAIPHGGGGPGVGPVCAASHLAPFLPSHHFLETEEECSSSEKNVVSAAPWGSSLILLISYAYIYMLGEEGLTKSSKYSILNANYIKARLEKDYDILYQDAHGLVAHELIVDCRPFKDKGITVMDVAKRLIDYGFHPPTVSFPVAGTLMIEPTESESKEELDRFSDAMLSIKKEIDAIDDVSNNLLKNAPHTLSSLTSDTWSFPYSREQAAYPLSWIHENKFWPAVARVDDAFGDRNLQCTCLPIEEYQEA